MYIEHHDERKRIKRDPPAHFPEPEKNQKVDAFFNPKPAAREKLPETPRDYYVTHPAKDILAHWRAPEYEVFERDKKWYLVVTLVLLGIIGWAVYSNSPVMAITFILIGIVGYFHINREPLTMDFMITPDGVVAGREIYEFDDLKSFWIFYEPEGLRVISLHNKEGFTPYVHIPIHEENPAHIRQVLLEFIPEEKREPGLMDLMERLLRI